MVTATGTHTEVGGIARLTEEAQEPKTPLELRIAQFGRYLVVAALVLFVVVMALGLLRGLPFADVLMVAISQMVSMVPEGLPVAMTIALAVGMQRMAGRGAIIRRLSAVETLGSTTVICSDKTGTLTRNEMTVSALWLPGGRAIAVSGVGYAPEGAITEAGAAVDPEDTAVRRCCKPSCSATTPNWCLPTTTWPSGRCSAIRPRQRCSSPQARPASTCAPCASNARAKRNCPSTPTPR